MSSDIIPLSAIPTISDLYKSSRLQSASSTTSLPRPSSSLNSKVSLIRTSITDLGVTSIVNAANESLLGGGGVDGAIHRAAGRSLLAECRTLDGCDTGSAKITSGHALPASYVIHAVGPVYVSAKRESPTLPAELLAGCYHTSLRLAAEKGGSIAFSCLSTGVYGYPSSEAAEVALGVVREWLVKEEEEKDQKLERVVFCCFENKDERAYQRLIPNFFPPTAEDLPHTEPAQDTQNTTDLSPSSLPLDTQASSLVAAAEKSANNEDPNTRKLKVMNPDVEPGDWETIEKPEELLETESAGEKDVAKSRARASGTVDEAIPESIEEKPATEKKEESEAGNIGKNSLLKDW